MSVVSILTVSWRGPATAILVQAIACSKFSLLLRKVRQRVLVFLLHPRQTPMGRRGWQAIEVPQGWFNVIVVLAHRQLAEHPTARWGPSISGKPIGQTRQERSKVSPEVVMENVRKQVSGSRSSHCSNDCEWHGREFCRGDDSQRVIGEGEAERPGGPDCKNLSIELRSVSMFRTNCAKSW